MRRRLTLLALGLIIAAPAASTVAPLTPEGRLMMAQRDRLERGVQVQFGPEVEDRARDWRRSYGAVIVADARPGAQPRLLIKDEYGWYEVGRGSTRRLPLPVGDALNRLLLDEALWQEQAFRLPRTCRTSTRLFILRHAGREQIGRSGCGVNGLAGQAAEVAFTKRVPSRPVRSTAQVAAEPDPPGVPPGQQQAVRQIFHRLSEMAAASERKILTAFVDPYAPDVVMERPGFALRGRAALVEHARTYQDWAAPGLGRALTVHQANFPRIEGDHFHGTHELRWEEDGQPVRQTFSTLWRKRNGLWEIAHERGSEVKPVTDRRP